MTTDEGKAILGSPNGGGVGYFLSQHRNRAEGSSRTDLLGVKTVESVQIFRTEGPGETEDDKIWYQAIFKVV
jgi:hypothetical protein